MRRRLQNILSAPACKCLIVLCLADLLTSPSSLHAQIFCLLREQFHFIGVFAKLPNRLHFAHLLFETCGGLNRIGDTETDARHACNRHEHSCTHRRAAQESFEFLTCRAAKIHCNVVSLARDSHQCRFNFSDSAQSRVVHAK